MKLCIQAPGMLTTVQDTGRWGHQAIGMPVCGAMDVPALVRGNILLGNPDGAAALEVTMTGPTIQFKDLRGNDGAVAITGGDLSPKLNGQPVPNWTVVPVREGDTLSFGGAGERGPWGGCRAYVCVTGGIDVPVVMGSRSTYIRAGIGGLEGRKLRRGDELTTGEPGEYTAGTSCPETLRPVYGNAPLRTIPGPQDSYIEPEGIKIFFETEYRLSVSSDRMGCRMEGGAPIKHLRGPDIISDAIPLGAVQVPGQGRPIVMMADRQTTGGYVKIGVVHALDTARLSQFLPGAPVRFARITQEQGIELSRSEAGTLEALRVHAAEKGGRGAANVTVNGRKFFVSWKKIN